MAVDAHARTARGMPEPDRARGGHERLVRVLGVDTALDGVAADLHVALGVRQLLARGDADLRPHQVDAGDQFGHRMLDLDAGVHLDEVELAVLVQELQRARAAVADRAHASTQRSPMSLRWRARDAGRGRFLDHLLVAPLHGAVALAQVDDVALAIGQHLESRCAAAAPGTSPCRPGRCRRPRSASALVMSMALSSDASVCTTRMPRPPPPPEALMITG